VTAPHPADNALRLLRARVFLYSRQVQVYGPRSLFYDLEKSYRDFDAMQKRAVLYARFGVREVVAEARASFSASGATLVVQRRSGMTPAKGGASNFEDFVRSKRMVPAPGAPLKRADLGGILHEIEIAVSGNDHLELALRPMPGPRRRGLRRSDRSLRLAWFEALLTEWIGSGSPLRLDGWPDPLSLSQDRVWTVSRRLSQADIDISGEAVPHVFRWKEATLAKSSTYAALDENDIAAALQAAGLVLPPNAHRQAALEEDLGQGGSCLLLRYAHLVPDPDPGADGNGATVPPQLSAGFIVMENDYLEILIDAGTGKVFSESSKWRPEPALAAPAPQRDPAEAVPA
jgi:hypothetical protein